MNMEAISKIEFDIPVQFLHLFSNESLKLKQTALLFYPSIQNGDISSGKVAEILGIHKSELLDIYGELGLPYFDLTEEELEKDLQNLKKYSRLIMIVIPDTAPIISLLKINRLDLLQELFGTVFIPKAVHDELTQNEKYELEAKVIINSVFIQGRDVLNQEAVRILETITQLDKGESEAIILFQELNAQLLLIDERRGRDVAERLQIPLSGTIGVLLKAFDKGLLTRQQILEYLDIFQQESRRFSPKLITLVNKHLNDE